MVQNILDDNIWRLVVLYGTPYDDNKLEFIDEPHLIMGAWQGPTLWGGDFNIVRPQREKSNDLINFNLVSQFNDWIDSVP
jgi:hypothetical protein